MKITQELLHEYFTYDGKILRWRIKLPYAKHDGVGSIAGGINSLGYRRITLHGRQYLAHRLIWLYVYGEWPKGMLDHINRIKDDNRIENLRMADMSLNVRNRDAYPSKTGVKGVYPCRDKYRASIQVGDTQRHLGVFDTIEQAQKARQSAEKSLWL